jgi:hypothetical protein
MGVELVLARQVVIFLRKHFYLAYINCTESFIVTFPYVLTMYLRFTPPSFSPILIPSFLKQFQQVSSFCFLQVYKVRRPYSPSFTLSIHPPTGTHHQTGPILHSCPFVLVCIHCSKGFHCGISPISVFYFKWIEPLYYSLSLPFPLSRLQCTLFTTFIVLGIFEMGSSFVPGPAGLQSCLCFPQKLG